MHAIDYAHEDFVEAVRVTTGGHGVDVVLDMVGGDYIERDLAAAPPTAASCRSPSSRAPRPRSISCGDAAAADAHRLDAPRAAPRPRRASPAIQQRIWPLVEAGKLKPVITDLSAHEAAEAHRLMERRTISARSCWWRNRALRDGLRPSSGYGRRPCRPLSTMRPEFPPRQGNPQLPNAHHPLYRGHSPSFDFGFALSPKGRKTRPHKLEV